jgi:hypothetical protein
VAILAALFLTAGACGSPTQEELDRNKLQAQKSTGDTLEKKNLEEKRKREEDPNAIGYVYLLTNNPNAPVLGYYVSKGKISSNSSQRTPEEEIVWTCGGNSGHYGCGAVVVDGPLDDGSFGDGDPGIFFFLTNGTKVVWGSDLWLSTDQPIAALNVPLLGGQA